VDPRAMKWTIVYAEENSMIHRIVTLKDTIFITIVLVEYEGF
jgi:hypothetical protein